MRGRTMRRSLGLTGSCKKGLDTLEQGAGLRECTQLDTCDVGMAVLDPVLDVPQLHRATLMTFSCVKQ